MAGFTAEELMALQDELEKDNLPEGAEGKGSETKTAEEEAAAKLAKEKEIEDGKSKDEKGGKDDSGKEGSKKEDEGKKDEKVVVDIDETQELRESNRRMQADLERVTKSNERLNKILKDKGLIDEEEEKLSKSQEEAAKAAYTERMSKLSEIVEVMSVNPAYEDVETVCSQKNFDEMLTAMARFYVAKEGGSLDETLGQISRQVWSLPNPYKYMYKMIKAYHPDFVVKKEEEKKADEGKEGKEGADGKKEEKEIKKAAPSLQDLPGGDGKGEQGGWTTERIDGLDEDELITFKAKFPEIYDKYLLGTLK